MKFNQYSIISIWIVRSCVRTPLSTEAGHVPRVTRVPTSGAIFRPTSGKAAAFTSPYQIYSPPLDTDRVLEIMTIKWNTIEAGQKRTAYLKINMAWWNRRALNIMCRVHSLVNTSIEKIYKDPHTLKFNSTIAFIHQNISLYTFFCKPLKTIIRVPCRFTYILQKNEKRSNRLKHATITNIIVDIFVPIVNPVLGFYLI